MGATGARLADRGRNRGQPTLVSHPRQPNCASAGTIALTVIAGSLNYVGVNPKVTNCKCAPTQQLTHTATSQPMNALTVLNQHEEPT
jgi:hypothetical protein